MLLRLTVGVVIAGMLGVLILGVLARYDQWGCPLLPSDSWPGLKMARTAETTHDLRVVVEPDVLVNVPEDGIQYFYCDLAADPQDPRRLFASSLAHTARSVVAGQHERLTNLAGFYSHDAGKTWTRAVYFAADTGNSEPTERESYSDATVCWGPDGSVFLAAMHGRGFEEVVPKTAGEMPANKNHGIEFWKSTNAGVDWTWQSRIPYFLDRPFTIVDCSSGPRKGQQFTVAQNTKLRLFVHRAGSPSQAAADGRFHALWIDSRDGTRQLRTTSFQIK